MIYRYHYSILWYEESLGDSAAVPFAVMVESKRHIYCLGFHLEGDESVTGQVLKNFPEILRERVAQADKAAHATKGRALDLLRKEFAWNIQASPVSTALSFRSIEGFGNHLFRQCVDTQDGRVTEPAIEKFFRFNLDTFSLAAA